MWGDDRVTHLSPSGPDRAWRWRINKLLCSIWLFLSIQSSTISPYLDAFHCVSLHDATNKQHSFPVDVPAIAAQPNKIPRYFQSWIVVLKTCHHCGLCLCWKCWSRGHTNLLLLQPLPASPGGKTCPPLWTSCQFITGSHRDIKTWATIRTGIQACGPRKVLSLASFCDSLYKQ